MRKHKISVTFDQFRPGNVLIARHIRRCIAAALAAERVQVPCEINVLVTNDGAIQEINKALREIDSATDVLSFPCFSLRRAFCRTAGMIIPNRRLDAALRDMAISLERAKSQAREFGHSVKREVGYLAIHSILHLLGYDHVDEAQMKRQMRAREEAILAEIVLPR